MGGAQACAGWDGRAWGCGKRAERQRRVRTCGCLLASLPIVLLPSLSSLVGRARRGLCFGLGSLQAGGAGRLTDRTIERSQACGAHAWQWDVPCMAMEYLSVAKEF